VLDLAFFPPPGGASFARVSFTNRQYSNEDMSHLVHFVTGRMQLQEGDRIVIDEIRGTADTIAPGNVYEIRGFYKLASQPKATLSTSVTSSVRHITHLRGLDDTQGPQRMEVEQGEGRFTLFLYMREEASRT